MAIFESNNIYSLSREQVDPASHIPFILTGYRKSGMSIKNCLKSIFSPYCNESFNAWSHLLVTLYLCVKFWYIFTLEFNITEPFIWPLVSFAFGMIGAFFMSFIAHTFCSLSPCGPQKCFYFDYAAMNILGVGCAQSTYFYTRQLQTDMFLWKSPEAFLSLVLITSLISTVAMCFSRKSHTLRASMQLLMVVLVCSPYLCRLQFCTEKVDCDSRGSAQFLKSIKYLGVAALAYVTKIPERFVEAKFDCIGQSHNLLHVLDAIGVDFAFDAIKTELVSRRTDLVNHKIQPTFQMTLMIMVMAFVLNLAICFFVKPGVGDPHVDKREKDN